MSLRQIQPYLCASVLLLLCSERVPEPLQPQAVQRLAQLCKTWNVIKYTHPYLASRTIDWDRALIDAIPRVIGARGDADFRAVLNSMLKALDDPVTHVLEGPQPSDSVRASSSDTSRHFGGFLLDPRLIVTPAYEAKLEEIAKTNQRIVIDLRAPTIREGQRLADLVARVAPILAGAEIQPPSYRSIVRWGYPPARGSTSGGFTTRFDTEADALLIPRFASSTRKLAFIVNERSTLPLFALAVQRSGNGIIVAEGSVTDAPVTVRRVVAIATDLSVCIRATELVGDEFGTFTPDVTIPLNRGNDAISEAMTREPAAAALAQVKTTLSPYQSRTDEAYASMRLPTLEYRMLALFRAWGVIDSFYPYKDLIRDWDSVLLESIPRFASVTSRSDYARGVMQLMSNVEDGHTTVSCDACQAFVGAAGVPMIVRSIDGEAVITEIADALASETGLERGNIIREVDGRPLKKRMESLQRLITASTPAHSTFRLLNAALRGPEEKPLKLAVTTNDGKLRNVTLRRPDFSKKAAKERQQPRSRAEGPPAFRVIRDVGYVDLSRLDVQEVDAMFKALRDTQEIVFDMRGYPRRTAWEIAPRLNIRQAMYGASFQRPVVGGASATKWRWRQEFSQLLPTSNRPKYPGRTFMLIDERTISQAEHSGLFFEAANGTIFIGTPSAGANGDVTNFCLPGDVWVTFSGHGVAHADGQQLQRVGLQPTFEVRPTVAGIRAGRDEVLDAALQFVAAERSGRTSRSGPRSN